MSSLLLTYRISFRCVINISVSSWLSARHSSSLSRSSIFHDKSFFCIEVWPRMHFSHLHNTLRSRLNLMHICFAAFLVFVCCAQLSLTKLYTSRCSSHHFSKRDILFVKSQTFFSMNAQRHMIRGRVFEYKRLHQLECRFPKIGHEDSIQSS